MTKRSKTAYSQEFKPSRDYSESKGFSAAEHDHMAEHFANHHQANGNVFASWDAAWRTWVLNEIKWKRPRGFNGQTELQSAVEQLRDSISRDMANGGQDSGGPAIRLVSSRKTA